MLQSLAEIAGGDFLCPAGKKSPFRNIRFHAGWKRRMENSLHNSVNVPIFSQSTSSY